MTDRVFVYGSLKPGRSRWMHLEPFAAATEEAEVRGQLWQSPWDWPALTEGDRTVAGVLVTLDPAHVDEALHVLDGIEGVDAGLFTRHRIATTAGTECWVYRWPSDTDEFVAIDGPW